MKNSIQVRERSFDWHAQIEGEPEKWECGKTSEEAINKLIQSFPFLKDASVSYLPKVEPIGPRHILDVSTWLSRFSKQTTNIP